MFSTIVVGTDGSSTADTAVGVALELTELTGATLYVVDAYQTPIGSGPVPAVAPAADDSFLVAATREAAESILAAVKARAPGLHIETRAVNGSAADGIVEVAREVGADLIVVGSKGMQGARRLLGSVPNTITHTAPCHVLIAKTV